MKLRRKNILSSLGHFSSILVLASTLGCASHPIHSADGGTDLPQSLGGASGSGGTLDSGDAPAGSGEVGPGPADLADTAQRPDVGNERMASDTSSCLMLNQRIPGLVCFGADETTYQLYLTPKDGGPMVGRCPAPDDFAHVQGEGAVSYTACGPLSPAEIALAHDAGVLLTTDGGTETCCFWVTGIPGV